MFNKTIYFNPLKNLHWKGFQTARELYSLDKFIDDFSELHPNYKNLRFFNKSYEYFSKHSSDDLKNLQKQFLDSINHDQYATIFSAFIPKREMAALKSQAELAFSAAIRFSKDIALNRGKADGMRCYLEKKYPSEIEGFDSIISTSLYNYGKFASEEMSAQYAKRADYSLLYAECGIDFMYGEEGWALSELQFSYQSYPQNLETLFRGLKKVFPDLMRGMTESSYPKRRAEQIEKFIEGVSHKSKIQRLVIDAWTALKHPTRNYMELATQLGAKYYLFDDFTKDQDGLRYRDITKDVDAVFIFNQALLYFLDPSPFFEPILHERLEEYSSIQLDGLYRDYIAGKVHLANPPLIDILNDKAIYRLLPYLVEFYFDQKLELAVSTPFPLWAHDAPLNCDTESIKQLLNHKDKWVICHRYLEGGDGIRVGRHLEQKVWEEFIEEYVKEKPYLFVRRKYFPMNPDVSFRIYCSGLFEEQYTNIESSNELLGRINPTGSLVEKSYFFLCQREE